MLQCCQVVIFKEILDQNQPVCWSIVVQEKPTAGSPFAGRLLLTASRMRWRMSYTFLYLHLLYHRCY